MADVEAQTRSFAALPSEAASGCDEHVLEDDLLWAIKAVRPRRSSSVCPECLFPSERVLVTFGHALKRGVRVRSVGRIQEATVALE